MKPLKLLLTIASIGLILSSCSDDDTPQLPGGVNEMKFVNATSYSEWTYFSFDQGDTIRVTNPATDLSWDIAFHRGDVKLNGGASGKGLAEAINMNTTDWNAVATAPKSGYKKDEVGTITTAFTGVGIETDEQPFSQELATWLTIDTSNPPPVYTYHNWIYVVKTASGKYVKLQIYDYKSAKNAGAYISFKYQYNESGATSFE